MRNQLAKPDSFTGLERMLNHKIQNLVMEISLSFVLIKLKYVMPAFILWNKKGENYELVRIHEIFRIR